YPLHTYVFLPAALGAFFAADRIARQRGWEQVYRPAVFCASLLLVPLCAAWLLNQLDLARVFARRFLITSSLAPPFLTALIGTAVPSVQHARAIAATVLGVGLFTTSPLNTNYYGLAKHGHSQEDWRGAV